MRVRMENEKQMREQTDGSFAMSVMSFFFLLRVVGWDGGRLYCVVRLL